MKLRLIRAQDEEERRRKIQYNAWLAAEGVAGSIKKNLLQTKHNLNEKELRTWRRQFIDDLEHEIRVVLGI
jgi:hypothetical protein